MIQTQPQWSKVSCLREQCYGKALPRLTKLEFRISLLSHHAFTNTQWCNHPNDPVTLGRETAGLLVNELLLYVTEA